MKTITTAMLAALAIGVAAPALAQHHATTESHVSDTEKNRAIVKDFFDILYVEKDVKKAFEKHVVPNYIQHNPMAADGRDAAIAAVGGFMSQYPDLKYDIKHVLVDGDMATVYFHMVTTPGTRGYAVMDMVRLENGKVVEHWDLMMEVPENSANPHPMF